MPIYMDVHIVPGVRAKDVAEAHRKDLLHQEEYECKCMTYWIDEQRETIFCLIEAPNKQAVEEMHCKAHGLIPNKIIEVSDTLVESFLGRIYDPADAGTSGDGLKIFNDPSFRVLVLTKVTDPVLLRYKFGSEVIDKVLDLHNRVIRKNISLHGGQEVEQVGSGFIISFTSASKAASCALSILEEMKGEAIPAIGFKICINAGEPIEKSNKLFGDTIQLANYLCDVAGEHSIAITNSVKDLIAKDHLPKKEKQFFSLLPQDESLLGLLFNTLEENWQDADFDVPEYCQAMTMSKSQLYRKATMLTGLSPNLLLKEFRLEKARESMKKHCHTIAQITFDSGFTSASYFTKCFKKKYGLLPIAYLDLLH
ncbi:MAG TPA: nickel-binding protein [Chitinophagaceae bacterium]|jgi:AraC-like DNA-binding protein|nr:nickel-binding protein [Chitinophagaceae bacterium]